ncbi:MAG TPA: biotin/lipoyl-containing protein, partial [Vicinamibacterales bacterium]|nr:biotin/lipoyl-containing protein [Vicinamibacterales bacterium]
MSNIVVPQLGESVVEARVARWLKKEGDQVAVGEPVVELETEKIDLEVNADHAGVIASIARHEGDDVKIGEVLGVLDESGAAAVAPAASAATASAPKAAPAAEAPQAAAAGADSPRATPTARRMAQQHDVNIGAV